MHFSTDYMGESVANLYQIISYIMVGPQGIHLQESLDNSFFISMT